MLKTEAKPSTRWPLSPSTCRRTRGEGSKFLYTSGTGALAGLLAILMVLAFTPSEVFAHGSNHPTPLRNARNQFINMKPQKPVPTTSILAEAGGVLDLGRFRGRLVLLNLWATWCPPCIDELPALDRLQEILGNEPFSVVVLSIDEGGIDLPLSFVRRLGLMNLTVYQDFSGRAQDAFPVYGLPITYLIGRDGLVVGYIVGAAKWDSPEAVRFLRHYIARANSG